MTDGKCLRFNSVESIYIWICDE